MGSLILCHKQKAKQPYEITRIHMRIYTLEELCYYVCNNLYLIDYTIVNHQMCDWIGQELGLKTLAGKLRDALTKNCSVEEFVLIILRESTIYAPAEINKIQALLEQFRDQNEAEREKYKADSLLESKEYESAILVYQSILNKEWDDSLNKSFYGSVYACLGTAYGRMFLYEEAAHMYEKAYQICEQSGILKAYLYCSSKAFPEEQYMKMMSGNPAYLSMNSIIKEDIQRVQRSLNLDIGEAEFARWKKEYRKIDKS